ncbi:MAG TPA: hypothetical protein PK781_03695 [Terrimesophilobacter sp.]|nr:hypothetical protein [Terrimesophilobacter sp.]HRP99546.1 hypothetical protein [Terrimesophilobacter sp.]
MRFIVAIFSFVLAFVMIGLGVAQRTIWAEPDQVVAEVSVSGAAPITFIDGAVLNSLEGRQKVDVMGDGEVFAAYGRTMDVMAWIGDATYNSVSFDPESRQLSTSRVSGLETFVPNPRGADVWLDEYSRADQLSFVVNVPTDVSLVLLTDGINPAPALFSISWPLDNRTPWSGPLIVGGVLLLLMGIGLYVWALAHFNRARGPRRKPPKLPKAPKRPKVKASKVMKPISLPNSKGRRAAGKSASMVSALVVASVVLTGCASGAELFSAGSAPSASAVPASEAPSIPPAVTESQMKRILSKVAVTANNADASLDAELAAERFAGPALELRAANYALIRADSSAVRLPSIPSTEIKVLLPQRTESWPRTVFTVVQEVPLQTAVPSASPSEAESGDAEGEEASEPSVAAPLALILVQETPRDNFKVTYAVSLAAGVALPELAAPATGSARLQPNVRVLKMAPDQVASSYGDILAVGEASEFWKSFDMESDPLYPSIGPAAKAAIRDALPSVASISFANAPADVAPIAISTTDAGALVAVYLKESEVVEPVERGASINPKGMVKSLSGVSSTHTGVAAEYGDQLLFYVPPAGSDGKIVLVGFATHLLSAREL